MQKLKAERCFCTQAFTLARRSAGPGFFSFCHPELVEGFGKPLLSSCIGAVASCTVAVRHCTATLSGFINVVKVYTNKVSMYGYF